MHEYGYIRVGCAVPTLSVGDCHYNADRIIELIDEAHIQDIEVLVFPELAISGYTCGDLFLQSKVLDETEKELDRIIKHSVNRSMLIVIGLAVRNDNQVFNAACVINNGRPIGIVPKTYLPNYNEFYEKRWFSSDITRVSDHINICNTKVPFGTDLLFKHSTFHSLVAAVEICEDLWVPIPPSSYAALNGANLILNTSASNELVAKCDYRRNLVRSQSSSCITAYAYCSSGFGESTTDVVYSGHSIIAENGTILAETERFLMNSQITYTDVDIEKLNLDRFKSSGFSEHIAAVGSVKTFREVPFTTKSFNDDLFRHVDPAPFIPKDEFKRTQRLEEIFSIQTHGLAKRIKHIGNEKVVVGISGGLDSTLALLVCVKTYDLLNIDRKNIIGITMPGFGTSDRTYHNAKDMMKELGITQIEISIKDACLSHFKDIGHDVTLHDITYENVQARERTQILMDYANKVNGFVIGTGDLSELALGWATYNGDHMSMYGVNASIPKTLVKHIVGWVAYHEVNEKVKKVLEDIIDTPVSPELLPLDQEGNIQQKTEESVGPYELHDFFLYYVVRQGFRPKKIYLLAQKAFRNNYDNTTIYKWLRKFYWRFFTQQFKRSCLPDGPKVGTISLSPRGDWRMPSDVSVEMWLKELDEIEEGL